MDTATAERYVTDTDYSPFPEQQLLALAAFHDDVASKMQSTFLAGVHTDRANACRNAIKSQEALRERCLIAEMELGQLRGAA